MPLDLSAPLNNLLKKEVPWEWTEQHQTCFEKIKQALTTTTVLTHFDPDIPIGLVCDAMRVSLIFGMEYGLECGME